MAKTKTKDPEHNAQKRIWIIPVVIIVALGMTFGIGVAFNLGNMGIRTNNFLAGLPVTNIFFKPIEQQKTPEQLEEENRERTERMLEQQRINLEELSGNLTVWEQQLEAKEEELMEQKEAIQQLQQRLEARLQDVEELVTYYENMDAADAVNILNNMSDSELVVVILKNMKHQKSSEILAEMDPRRAARLMEMMSGI